MDFNLMSADFDLAALSATNQNDDELDDDEELMAELLALENDSEESNIPVTMFSSHSPLISTPPKQVQAVAATMAVISAEASKQVYDQKIVIEQQQVVSPALPPRPVNFESVPKKLPLISAKIDSVVKSGQDLPFVKTNVNKSLPITVVDNESKVEDFNLIANKAKSILVHRRAKYLNNVLAAKEVDDCRAAGEFLNVVKQFDCALEAVQNGTELSKEDLIQIPPSPPPYQKKVTKSLVEELEIRASTYRQLVQKLNEEGQNARARMNERIANQYQSALKQLKKSQPVDVAALPIPPGFEPLYPELISQAQVQTQTYPVVVQEIKTAVVSSKQKAPKETNILKKIEKDAAKLKIANESAEITHNDQLKLVLSRQLLLKKAALAAKAVGDVYAAMGLLAKAKSLDQMIDAAQCGLPVNVKEIPIPPLPVIRQMLGASDKHLIIHREIVKQFKFADEYRNQFQLLGDTTSILFYEALLEKCVVDLETLAEKSACDVPKIKVLQKECPIVDKNPDIPDSAVDLRIERIEKLKLPDASWKPTDCALFVTFNFPFPHDAHQTGRTSTVRGSDKPEFSDTFRLIINRTMHQKLVRIVRRMPLKLEIYQKGGFLRSDKLWGHADVSLAELENSSCINNSFEILDGRKHTGGTIHIKIKISKPLAGEGKGTAKIKRKWIELI